MRRGQRFHPPEEILPHLADEMGNCALQRSAFNAAFPFHEIEFQPSEVCPRNFIIFDQTRDRSQFMYHPTVTSKLTAPALNMFSGGLAAEMEKETSASLEEDSDEINVLLGLEEEEECNEEEVSTARTSGHHGSNSPGSCSSTSKSSKGESKRAKMKKMMKVLRGIVPGGEHINPNSVIDETVRYLKSLKVEAEKLGVGYLQH